MLHRPEPLHDFLNEVLEPRCTVSSRDVEMVFMSRNLSNKKKKKFNKSFLVAQRKFTTHVFHMQNKQPLLVHGIERIHRCEHRDQDDHNHTQEHDASQQVAVSKLVRKRQDKRESNSTQT